MNLKCVCGSRTAPAGKVWVRWMETVCAVEKALDLLEYLADGKEAKVIQAAFALGLTQANVVNIARGLSNKGFLVQDTKRQTVRIGPKLVIRAVAKQPRAIAENTPKGLDNRTLRDIKAKLAQMPGHWECTATEMANIIGISRVTARRYLEYLVGEGVMNRRNQYTKIGRPTAKYCIL